MFGAFGLLGAEVLADQRGGGVAESPRGEHDEDDDANGDGVAGESGRAEDADDADEADPAGVGDGELQDAASARHGAGAASTAEIHANLAAEDADAFAATEQAVELVEDADAAAGECG